MATGCETKEKGRMIIRTLGKYGEDHLLPFFPCHKSKLSAFLPHTHTHIHRSLFSWEESEGKGEERDNRGF